MATSNAGDRSNAEMGSETNTDSVNLSEFVKGCVLPECVCVTNGSFLSRNVQISKGDVLLLKSCDSGQATLSYQDETSRAWTEVRVDLDYPQKFHVLLPKEVNDENRAASMVIYPTIADLLLDCPTFFEATASYDDPYLPGMSVKATDRFWFVEVVKNEKDDKERLKVRDERGEFVLLSSDCRGNFYPLKDDKEYTIKELINLSPVQRRLQVTNKICNGDSPGVSVKKDNETIDESHQDEYTPVLKPSYKPQKKDNFVHVVPTTSSLQLIPETYSGVIHLLKHEPAVNVSPYNEPETTWTVPLSANLKVRTYTQNDYEIPAPRKIPSHPRVPLPLTPADDLPIFRAPSAPSATQPLTPMNISQFADIYCSSLPVKARIISMTEVPPFLQEVLKDIEEILVYRTEEDKRLYVKDAKCDTVYSLSQNLKLSFIEYPETFKSVSELLHLPLGSEVTVLEDIAADFPKPFSLRFGDVIRITSNTPYFVKMKHVNRDCQVIKCERVDPEGGENSTLKLPMDFELSLVMVTDSSNKRMLSLNDLITGAVPIPNQIVASVPDSSDSVLLKDLPVDLRILRAMKESCLVIASSKPGFPASVPSSALHMASSKSPKEKVTHNSSEQALTNIGLPFTCGVVMAFRDRLDLFELDLRASEADYIRLPVEKMTLAQFEERERMRKLNIEYEDVEFGSNSTLDECEAGAGASGSIKSGSTGLADMKQKGSKMDKMLRLSRALNPKHWRHSKAEPEPLPHPSAMGLMALAARPKNEVGNDYHHGGLESSSSKRESVKSGCSAADSSNAGSEEEENFYEDVEIGPIKRSTISAAPERQTGVFSGPAHRSLPHRMTPNLISKSSKSHGKSDGPAIAPRATELTLTSAKPSSIAETHEYDVPKPLLKAKNWAANLGNNIGERISMVKARYDVPRNNRVTGSASKEAEDVVKTDPSVNYVSKRPPDSKPPPLPPPNSDSKPKSENNEAGSHPVPPARLKGRKSQVQGQSNRDDKQLSEQSILKSSSSDGSLSRMNIAADLPKPKPRGLKKPMSLEEVQPRPEMSPPPNMQRPPRSIDTDKSSVTQSRETVSSISDQKVSVPIVVKENSRPKPPPKSRSETHTTV